MNESDFEKELGGMKPVAPSRSLEGRIAAALPESSSSCPAWGTRLLERLCWAAGGAAAAWALSFGFGIAPVPAPAPQASPQPVAAVSTVSEEPIAWSDEGVQFIDGQTPARMLRRLVMERHYSPDGSAEVRVPRQDVILVPVALR